MSDTEFSGCATVVEVLVPGPQGPGGAGNGGIGGYSVAIENVATGHVLVFDGEVWENRPQADAGAGDMARAVYDADGDGKVDAAEVADAVAWAGIADVPEAFPPAAHTHAIAGVTGLGEALAAKADAAAVTEALADRAGLASPAFTGTPKAPTAGPGTNTDQIATTAFVAGAVAAAATDWDGIDGKPEAFPPAAHGHAAADVAGLADVLAAKADALSVTAALAGKADASAIPAAADAAVLLGGTDAAAFATGKAVADANTPLALDASAATVDIDLAARRNFTLTLPGNRTLANPANVRAGQSGCIWVTRSAAGAALSFGPDWKPAGGGFALGETTGTADLVTYLVVAPGVVAFNVLGGFEA